MGYLDKALAVAARIEKEKPQGISPGRREALAEVMEAVLLCERDKIIGAGSWKPTDKTREIERQIDALYLEILEGRGTLESFTKLCGQWRQSGMHSQFINLALPGIN